MESLSFLAFLLKRPNPLAPPMHYHLEATNICNLKCSYCPYEQEIVPPDKWGYMDPALLGKILEQIRKLKPGAGVSLHLGGEPMLHPEIDRLVCMVREQLGLRPMIATNATLLTEQKADRIVRAGGAHLQIDFAADSDVYESMRTGAEWEGTRRNIAYALNAGLSLYVCALDNDVQGLQNLFGDHSHLDIVPFRMHNVGGSFASVLKHRFDLKPDRTRYHPCTHLWFGMAVSWSGHVVLCCRDVLHQHIVGDLNKQGIEEVWHGPELCEARMLHARNMLRSLSCCETCDRPYELLNSPWMVFKRYSPLSKIFYRAPNRAHQLEKG